MCLVMLCRTRKFRLKHLDLTYECGRLNSDLTFFFFFKVGHFICLIKIFICSSRDSLVLLI